MYRSLALALSVIFQPLLIPTIIFALLFYVIPEATSVPRSVKGSVMFLVMATTLLIPLISVIGMRLTNTIESIHMKTTKDRVFPFSMVTLFYLITTYFFTSRLDFDPLLGFTLSVITACIVVLTLITYFWKISAHTTGLAGMLAIVIVLNIKFNSGNLLYPLIFSILLCGAVMSSRLYLNAHRPLEVLAGFILGFTICFFSFYYFLII